MHRIALFFFALLLACASWAGAPEAGQGSGLRAKYDEMRPKLERNAFGRPLHLVSGENERKLAGDVYAILEFPFAQVESGLTEAASWCDVLILPFNTKHCHATDGSRLAVRIGRKASQAPEDAYPIDFRYGVSARAPDYLRIDLKADKGPLGTQDYSIALEAVPLDDRRTFIHLGYSYGFSTISRMAMQAYLSTAGAGKVGFTQTGRDSSGQPTLVGGMLGATERNTMRYFLAIDCYLRSLAAPVDSRVEKRLQDWFTATERYPRQLHEMDKGEYVAMKRKEISRNRQSIG
jgi:hypothetical protein